MDEVYLQKVLNGQIEEFGYFIRTYKNLAFNLAITIVKNESDAEEIAQDAFIKAYRFLRGFDRRSKFSSWFTRIVINCAYKHIANRKKADVTFLEDADLPIEPLSEELDQYDKEEKAYYIQRALNLIGPDESLALHLFYIQDFSMQEIMESTSWSLSKTKVTLHRARISFKSVLQKIMQREGKFYESR
jgi:RNA polymerase sigma-70 factor (ECF subfamily)